MRQMPKESTTIKAIINNSLRHKWKFVPLTRFIEKDGGTRPCDILATRVADQFYLRAGCQLLPTMWGR
jgi:hypothetical protein